MPTKSGLTPYFMNAVHMEPERLWRKVFVEQMGFKSGVKGWGSDRWWEWSWGLVRRWKQSVASLCPDSVLKLWCYIKHLLMHNTYCRGLEPIVSRRVVWERSVRDEVGYRVVYTEWSNTWVLIFKDTDIPMSTMGCAGSQSPLWTWHFLFYF